MAIPTEEEFTGTFAYESKLPKLPLPVVEETLDHLKKSLEPLYYADGYYKHPLDPEHIKELSNVLEEFSKSNAASALQSKLREFYDTNDSYLDKLHLDINNHTSTREISDDILPRNPFLIIADDAIPDITQGERAACLVHSALRYISALKTNKLPPDVNSKTNQPLSMYPYLNLFGTTRCPVFQNGEIENFDLNKPYTISDLEEVGDGGLSSEDEDEVEDEDDSRIVDTRPTSSKSSASDDENDGNRDIFTRHGITISRYSDSKHILIISQGQYYTFDVLDDDNDILYTSVELASFIDYVLDDSEKSYNLKKSTALGSLTSHSYKNWKYARKRLQKRYPQELHLIDSALFVLVLDESDEEPNHIIRNTVRKNDDSDMELSENCKRIFYGTSVINEKGHQVGSCVSRWYDKLQLVVTKDSKAAVIWDSFTCDGSVVLRFTSEMYTESVLRLAKEVNSGDPRFSLWPNVSQTKNPPKKEALEPTCVVHKIDWSFSNILNTHVHLSETKLADLIARHDLVRATIPLGRRSAQRLGTRPDSMIQVALQVAHYALYGKMIFGLEPVSTRAFKNSRSSFINIQNRDLLELCQLFISSSVDGPTKLDKFIQTCEKHTEAIRKAKGGSGYEKHFNALRYLYKFHDHFGIEFNEEDERIASNVFDNSLIAPFSQPELIVANCGNAATTTFGITPAVPQGFGIGYIIKDDQCDITVTSQFRQGNRLMFMLNWVLNEVRSIWRESRNTAYNKTGIKISPLVDKLYELDNARNATKSEDVSSGTLKAALHQTTFGSGGLGFFDIDAHIDSRSLSATPPVLKKEYNIRRNDASSSKLTSKLAALSVVSENHSSSAFSIPTENEKQNTGFQIPQMQPHNVTDSSDDDTSIPSSRPESRRRNVINSKFEINFDRAHVGRKVVTYE